MDWTTFVSSAAAAVPVAASMVGWVYAQVSKQFKKCDAERSALEKRVTSLEALQTRFGK